MNDRSPDAVAIAGVRAIASVDTVVDRDAQHTAIRAALVGWLTPDYARAVRAAKNANSADAQWTAWARHRAYLRVTARLNGDDRPPDTATVAARTVLLTEQPIGRDGWRGAPRTVVAAVVLHKVEDVWRIDDDTTS